MPLLYWGDLTVLCALTLLQALWVGSGQTGLEDTDLLKNPGCQRKGNHGWWTCVPVRARVCMRIVCVFVYTLQTCI